MTNDSTQKTLGILLATAPSETSHQYGVRLAARAQETDHQVFLYLLDDAVAAASGLPIRDLLARGVKISGCAYAAQRRGIELTDEITYGGLGILNEIIRKTDRFVAFCN